MLELIQILHTNSKHLTYLIINYKKLILLNGIFSKYTYIDSYIYYKELFISKKSRGKLIEV